MILLVCALLFAALAGAFLMMAIALAGLLWAVITGKLTILVDEGHPLAQLSLEPRARIMRP